jgi:hypothetical protein
VARLDHRVSAPLLQKPISGIQNTLVDSMATVVTQQTCNQSAKRPRSSVEVTNFRTGCTSGSWGLLILKFLYGRDRPRGLLAFNEPNPNIGW